MNFYKLKRTGRGGHTQELIIERLDPPLTEEEQIHEMDQYMEGYSGRCEIRHLRVLLPKELEMLRSITWRRLKYYSDLMTVLEKMEEEHYG